MYSVKILTPRSLLYQRFIPESHIHSSNLSPSESLWWSIFNIIIMHNDAEPLTYTFSEDIESIVPNSDFYRHVSHCSASDCLFPSGWSIIIPCHRLLGIDVLKLTV